MTQDDKTIVTSIKSIKFFMREVGSMLSTLDGGVKEKGWELHSGSTLGGHSGSISNPFMWVPSYIFRFYHNADHLNYFGFSSVLLYPPAENLVLEGALIAAGILKYPEGFDVNDNNNWPYDYAYSHLKMPDRKDDGTCCLADKDNLWQNKDENFKITTFAYPLSEVSNQAALTDKMINKFFNLFDELNSK